MSECQQCGKLGGKVIALEVMGGSTSRWVCPYCLEADRQLRAEMLAACDFALNALIGCAVPAGGCDDRAAILDAQARLRAAITKAGGRKYEEIAEDQS